MGSPSKANRLALVNSNSMTPLAEIERLELEASEKVATYLSDSAGKFPPYMAELVHRSAMKLWARWPDAGLVNVEWRASGESSAFLSRIEWPQPFEGPRIVVLDERTGEIVCKSLPWRFFDIDPRTVNVDHRGDEEHAHEAWQGDAAAPVRMQAHSRR